MAARGRAVTSSWLMQAEGAVTPDESMMLGLGPGASVYRFRRIRFADELPMAIEHSAIAGFALAEADAVRGSPYRAGGLRQPPVRALQRLRAVRFTPEQAKLALRRARRGSSSSAADSSTTAARWKRRRAGIAATPATSSPS